MDRYTTRINDSVYYAKGKRDNKTLAAECDHGDVRAILKRLAEYEDTGLEPSEIIKLQVKNEEAEKRVKQLTDALIHGVANNERNERGRYGRR